MRGVAGQGSPAYLMPMADRLSPNISAARHLRASTTRSEALLWERLRARRFGGLKFRRQHPVGAYVLDFYCAELALGIEVDGGVHRTADARTYDAERDAVIAEAGILLVRVAAEAVETDADQVLREVLDTVRRQ